MLNSPCVVKYSIIYRACGALDAELCTTSWAPVLTNSKFQRVFLLTYGIFHVFINCSKNYKQYGALML